MTHKITIYLPIDLVEEIRRMAKESGMTISKYTANLVAEAFEQTYSSMEDIILKASTLTRRSPEKIRTIISRYSNPALCITSIFSNVSTFRLAVIEDVVRVSFINLSLVTKKVSEGEKPQKAIAEAREFVKINLHGRNKHEIIHNFLTELYNIYTPTVSKVEASTIAESKVDDLIKALGRQGVV